MLAKWRVWSWFGLALTATILVVGACAVPGSIGTAEIDWVSFIRFGGITYLENSDPYTAHVGRALQVSDLGVVFDRVRHDVADSVHSLGYQLQDGDAAFLPVGTPVSTVRGYRPTFRLAAQYQGRLVLYEADTNPQAKVGQDLLDIAGKVRSISVVSSHDGVTELAALSDPAEVATLVAMVLTAPVSQGEHNHGGTQYLLAFHLQDGTATVRMFWVSSGELARGIMLPKGFGTAITSAIASRSTTVTSTTFVDYAAPALGVVVDAQRRVVDIELTPRFHRCAETACATVTSVPVGGQFDFL